MCARDNKKTSVSRVSDSREYACAPVPVKLCPDGECAGPPEVALDNPVELVCEDAAVEGFHIGPVGRCERRREGRHGSLLGARCALPRSSTATWAPAWFRTALWCVTASRETRPRDRRETLMSASAVAYLGGICLCGCGRLSGVFTTVRIGGKGRRLTFAVAILLSSRPRLLFRSTARPRPYATTLNAHDAPSRP